MGFEWRTDEEDEWPEELPPSPDQVKQPRRWHIWFLLIFLLSLGSYSLYYTLNREVTAVQDTLQSDVLAGHLLIHQAANQDTELFTSLLWPGDLTWLEMQQQLQQRRLFNERLPLGLRPVTSTTSPISPTQVLFSNDLTEAQVIAVHPYQKQDGEPIWLQETAVYRYDDHRWLRAPLPNGQDFWGQYVRREGKYVTLFFSERDAPIGEQLLLDLDNIVSRICEAELVPCPVNFRVHISLLRDEDALLTLGQNVYIDLDRQFNSRRYTIHLPSPTLVGWPLDEAAYVALSEGYSSWVATAVIAGLQPPTPGSPDTTADQLALLNLTVPQVANTWQSAPLSPPPISWPEQDVQLICHTNGQSQLLQYAPATGLWQDKLTEMPSLTTTDISMTPLPDDSGVLVSLHQLIENESHWQTFAWTSQGMRLLLDEATPTNFWPFTAWLAANDPEGRYLIGHNWHSEGVTIQVLDLQQCSPMGCDIQAFAGMPFWSPDHRYVLLSPVDDGAPRLYLQAPSGQVEQIPGNNSSPFWLDNATYGYVQKEQSLPTSSRSHPEMRLITAVVSPTTTYSQTVVTTNDLMPLLPGKPPLALVINRALNHPRYPDTIYLYTLDVQDHMAAQTAYLFALNHQTEEIRLVWQLTHQGSHAPPFFTRDGRYLILYTGSGLLLFDPLTEEVASYPQQMGNRHDIFFDYDFSKDGRWLLFRSQHELLLAALGQTYEQRVPIPLDDCIETVWVDK